MDHRYPVLFSAADVRTITIFIREKKLKWTFPLTPASYMRLVDKAFDTQVGLVTQTKK